MRTIRTLIIVVAFFLGPALLFEGIGWATQAAEDHFERQEQCELYGGAYCG